SVLHVEYAEFSCTYAALKSVVSTVASDRPADRSIVTRTSLPLMSTIDLSAPLAPPWQTQTPLIATLSSSGTNVALVVPMAASTRPQLGSSPVTAHLNRLHLATARPTATASCSLAAPTTSM